MKKSKFSPKVRERSVRTVRQRCLLSFNTLSPNSREAGVGIRVPSLADRRAFW